MTTSVTLSTSNGEQHDDFNHPFVPRTCWANWRLADLDDLFDYYLTDSDDSPPCHDKADAFGGDAKPISIMN